MRKGRSFVALQKEADYTLTENFINEYAAAVGSLAEMVWTVPAPQAIYDDREIMLNNGSTGWQSISCNDGFLDSSDGMLIPPGGEVLLRCVKSSTTGYKWVRVGYDQPPKWQTYVPTLAWTTATPADVDVTARYMLTPKGLCHVDIEIILGDDDGAGATAVTATPPPGAYPMDVEIYAPLYASQSVGGAVPTNPMAYIDCLNNTAASRLITCHGLAELTDNKACTIRIKGTYPVFGTTAYTPVGAFTTATPTSSSLIGLHTQEGGICYTWIYQVLSDGKGCTAITYTPPLPVKDTDQYVAGEGWELVDAAYSDPMPYLDSTHATMASRLIGNKNLTAMTDAKGAAIAIFIAYEIDGWYAYTPTETWDTKPDTWTSSMRYMIDQKTRICSIIYSGTSADGNGNAANGLTITLPVVPKYGTNVSLLCGYQLVNTTPNKPAPIITHSTVLGVSRAVIAFEDLSAMTNAVTTTVYVSGFFEID